MANARDDLLTAALAVFDKDGFEGATVAAIRERAGASNGSFFHFFNSKRELAGTLFLEILRRYHIAMLDVIDPLPGAEEGIARLIRTHLAWVVDNRREANFLFEISRSEWAQDVREGRMARNATVAESVEAWRAPLVASGDLLPMKASLFLSQIIGPAQFVCRAWLSGRDPSDPRDHADTLIACAVRALTAKNLNN